MASPQADAVADLRRAGRDHREAVEREERALILLHQAICGAYDADLAPEVIAEILGWPQEQVLAVLAMC